MTDKQIIDKCEFFYKEKGWCNNGNLSSICEENEDCLYKKYLRKEQECEELKEQLTILDDEDVVVEITVKQFEEYKKLKAENDELKKDLDFQKNMYECARADEEDKFEEILELKQTLTEIKEIANKFDYWNSNLSQASEILHAIIERISEVEALND